MKKNNKLIIGMIFMIGIFVSLTFVSGFGYSRSSVRYTQPGMSSFNYMRGSEGINLYPILDRDQCGVGQDFIIQVAPEGCTPPVVRSDLLEEQNVPVFCPLMATKVNPLIDVEAIDHIRFEGNYPEGVSGIGFHPANAALKTSAREMLNSPVMENIGYAVVVLNKQRNESAMPEWITGNMTAVLRYDVENAFGVGAAQFNLPLVDEENWDEEYRRYGFWKGKGYLRAEDIGVDSARISVFRDVDTRLSSKNLRVGETSDMIYLPGFYCLAGFELRLDGLEAPDTRARFEVEGDYFESAKGEMFLDNKCRVRSLEKQGLVQEVEVSCETDNHDGTFKLEISPKINLKINGVNGTYEVGDILYTQDDERNVFLGFIGETKKTKFIVPVVSRHTSKEKFLASADRGLIKNYVDYRLQERSTGFKFIEGWKKIAGSSADSFGRLFGGFVRGTDYADLIGVGETKQIHFFSEDVKKVVDTYFKFFEIAISKVAPSGGMNWDELFDYDAKHITFIGFVEPADKKIGVTEEEQENFQNYFNQAKQNYRKLADSFKDEREDLNNVEVKGNTYAEKGLFELIELAKNSEQKKTMIELGEEFLEKYPESDFVDAVEDYLKDDLKNSNSGVNTREVYINGRLKTISFEGIYEPSFEDYGADLRISGSGINIDSEEFEKNEIYYFGDGEDYIQLVKVEDDYVEIDSNVEIKGKEGKREVLRNFKIEFGDDYAILGKGAYRVSINEIHLKKEARVKVIPKIRNGETEAEFDFKIGIEKRAIQLSPEKIESKIDNLDKQIEKWGKISNTLDKTVKVLNTACLGTGAVLTIKNLLANTGGKALAREKVMRGENGAGGWFDYCAREKEAERVESIDQCLYDKADVIDVQVDEYAKTIDDVNEGMKSHYTYEKTIAGDIVDKDEFIKDYSEDIVEGLPDDVSDDVKKLLNYEGYDNGYFYEDDLRDIDLYSRLAKDGDEDAKENLKNILSRIEKTSGTFAERSTFANENGGGYEHTTVGSSKSLDEIGLDKYLAFESLTTNYDTSNIGDNDYVHFFKDAGEGGEEYMISYDGDGVVKNTYLIGPGNMLASYEDINSGGGKNPFGLKFKQLDASTYENKFIDAKIQYYETEPYKGFPGLVPFDLKNGWYAATRQSLPGAGNIQAFDESGRVASFYLCNVGKNGRADFHQGIKDDICRGFNPANGQIYGSFPGLDERDTGNLVRNSINAIREAQDKYKRGVKKVDIPGAGSVAVGGAVANVPEIQCQDFMSPKECHILFNVCDPVVCPTSRCNLGGNYYVEDVIQTGIIGGVTLCAHNFDGGKGVIMPVCLSGINAGVDGLLSMSESYRDCLSRSLETGETVGICDEIHSIYLCEFLWRQAVPFAKLGIPKILEFITGQNAKGGGEYLSVSSAWKAAGDSVDYFKNYYGANAYNAFKYRSTEDVGTDVCKLSLSASVPVGGDFIDSLTEPVSPVQYHARFDEIPFTTATNPPISHYKVFYHIYAGKDIGAYYRIYLKGSEGTALYQDNPVLKIADGYIGVGEYATETLDFTGSAGYKQLCVNINAQEKCGFKEVSTSFAVDYVRDKYLEDQASAKDITTEGECVSGSRTAYSLLNPNLQEGFDDALNPDLYNRGIVRVCATDSPGVGTDVKDGTKDARWVPVGYCGDKDLKCWIDTSSVSEAISIDYIEENALGKTVDNYQEMLAGNYLSEGDYVGLMGDLEEMNEDDDSKLRDVIVRINSNYDKVFLTNQKAGLTYYLARANGFLARNIWKVIDDKRQRIQMEKEIEEEYAWREERDESLEEEEERKKAEEEEKESIEKDLEEKGVEISPKIADYQKFIGEKIMELAKEKKKSLPDDVDEKIKEEGIAESFECMILQVAKHESTFQHCKEMDYDNPLYCDDGGLDDLNKADDPEESYGVMQINIGENVHPKMRDDVDDFEKNVNYGMKVLIDGYNQYKNGKLFTSTGETYYGWEAGLRTYNGWGSGGQNSYVEDVEDEIYYVGSLFGECGKDIVDGEGIILDVGNVESPLFTIKDGRVLKDNINFIYYKNKWLWSVGVTSLAHSFQHSLEDSVSIEKADFHSSIEDLIERLKQKDYSKGVEIMMDYVSNDGGGWFADPVLSTEKVEMSHDSIFKVNVEGKNFYFKYNVNEWDFSRDGKEWEGVTFDNELKPILGSLEGKNLVDGAEILFGLNIEEIIDKQIDEEEKEKDVEDEVIESEVKTKVDVIEDVNILITKRFWFDKRTDSLSLPVEEDVLLEVRRFGEDVIKNGLIKTDYLLKLINPVNGKVYDLKQLGYRESNFVFVLPFGLFKDAKNGEGYKYKVIAERENVYDVYDGEIKIEGDNEEGIGTISQEKGGLSDVELENIKSATKCEDCGKGFWNVCDELECLAIGEKIGMICVNVLEVDCVQMGINNIGKYERIIISENEITSFDESLDWFRVNVDTFIRGDDLRWYKKSEVDNTHSTSFNNNVMLDMVNKATELKFYVNVYDWDNEETNSDSSVDTIYSLGVEKADGDIEILKNGKRIEKGIFLNNGDNIYIGSEGGRDSIGLVLEDRSFLIFSYPIEFESILRDLEDNYKLINGKFVKK